MHLLCTLKLWNCRRGRLLPIKGTDSDVLGVVADTIFRNRVSDSSIVISAD